MANRRLTMRQIREILRLQGSQELSMRAIARSLGVASRMRETRMSGSVGGPAGQLAGLSRVQRQPFRLGGRRMGSSRATGHGPQQKPAGAFPGEVITCMLRERLVYPNGNLGVVLV